MTSNFEKHSPVITPFLIVTMVWIFIFQVYNPDLKWAFSIINFENNHLSYSDHFMRALMANFTHFWFLHLFFNSMVLLYIWNACETRFWSIKYVILFIITTVICYLIVWFFSHPVSITAWMSAFIFANITLLWASLLKEKWSYLWASWKDWISLWTIMLLWMAVFGNVSFLWHLGGYLAWIVSAWVFILYDSVSKN